MLERMREARQRDHEALVANTLPSADDGGPWRPNPHGYLDIGGNPSGSVQVTLRVPVHMPTLPDIHSVDWQAFDHEAAARSRRRAQVLQADIEEYEAEQAPPPPPDLDPEQARRRQLSAELMQLTLEDEQRLEEERHDVEDLRYAEDFERKFGGQGY
jgi:hypothetical protein